MPEDDEELFYLTIKSTCPSCGIEADRELLDVEWPGGETRPTLMCECGCNFSTSQLIELFGDR